MCPTGVPESSQRRRSRAGSNEGVGDLSAIPIIPMESKSAPSSPKMESNRFLHLSKLQQDSCCQLSSLSDRAWASLSREHLANEEENESGLTDKNAADRQSLFRDLCQTQLSLWTFAVSTLLTYFWQKRVHVRSVLFAVVVMGVTTFVSGVLAAVVVGAHVFNSDFAGSFGGLGDWLGEDDAKYPHLVRRQSSSFNKKSRRCTSGSTTPRGGDKFQQSRFWQKNVATLERTYIGSSRS